MLSRPAPADPVAHPRPALARFESGDYGLCTRCEEEIGVPRLQASPTAVLCIECASRGE